jgi:uncharacterized membrane protein
MTKTRLEAFSDGVIAILITIMVLELHIPHGADWAALRAMAPALLIYALSFVNLGIYWTNHHHFFQLIERVNGKILWANLHLLFWLSLVPVGTAWLGENPLVALPAAAYGVILLMAALAWTIMQRAVIQDQGPHSKLAEAVGRDRKGNLSNLAYLTAIPLAFVHPYIADALYACVACMWLIPDRRIESRLHH